MPESRLRIAFLDVPGRFPTVVRDPGGWWGAVAADERFALRYLPGNGAWWRLVCGAAPAAARALESLRRPETFAAQETYLTAVAILCAHLEAMNAQLEELELTLERGPRVRGLDYGSSRALAEYARRDGRLARSMDALLEDLRFDDDVLLLATTSPEDLLCAMLLIVAARRRRPSLHASLIDHGYENFSLTPHLSKLRATGALEALFDVIVESKDDRDAAVPALLDALAHGERPRGTFRAPSSLRAALPPDHPARWTPPSADDALSFAPEPILWTRASPRRCYWNRCAFCVQNVKLDDPRTPSIGEIPAATLRLRAQREAGYRHLYLSDEALSPHFLRELARSLLASDLDLRWACRCKLEISFDRALGEVVHAAGCRELLFGVETVSPRSLRVMDKWVDGLDAVRTTEILHELNAAGLGIHVNLLAGFPGATLEETVADVDWAIATLRPMRSTTYTLNPFVLYPGTPVFAQAERFGIEPAADDGDMPSSYAYRMEHALVGEGLAIAEQLPRLAGRLATALGWAEIAQLPGGPDALALIHGSGHGCVLKALDPNPFANPLET